METKKRLGRITIIKMKKVVDGSVMKECKLFNSFIITIVMLKTIQ